MSCSKCKDATERMVPALALRPAQAAEALGICERTLYEWVRDPDLRLPHIRQGRMILFPVDRLRAWLADRAEQSTDE